jgi:hypothetical protein
MHRKVKTSADRYSPTDLSTHATISDKPYNLSKLMHRFKLVRSMAKH